MVDNLPESIRIRGEVGTIIGNNDSGVHVAGCRCWLYIESFTGEEELIGREEFEAIPNSPGGGTSTNKQIVDATFQRYIRRGDFSNVSLGDHRRVLELYAQEKARGLSGPDLTYRFRHAIPSSEFDFPYGLVELLEFRLTRSKDNLPFSEITNP